MILRKRQRLGGKDVCVCVCMRMRASVCVCEKEPGIVERGVELRARVCRVWWSARSALTRTNRLTG